MEQDYFAGLKRLAGRWRGTKRLWLDPAGPAADSAATAAITLEERNHIIKIVYTWRRDGERQEGQLLLGRGNGPADAQGMWADSWHMHHKIMVCQGHFRPDGGVSLRGAYPVADGPSWGWRIDIMPAGEGLLQITMDNITPAGEASRAVELRLQADEPADQKEN